MGRQSSIAVFFRAQTRAGKQHSALITDIDNTFYHGNHRAAATAAWELRRRATEAPYPIIAITGDTFEKVRQRIESGELPLFEVIVGDGGTDIWVLQKDGSFARDNAYLALLAASEYNRREIVQMVRLLLPMFHRRGIRMQFQDPEKEAAFLVRSDPEYLPYKVGLHFFGDEQTVAVVNEVFTSQCEGHKIVICEEIHHNALLAPNDRFKKYCLDILPATKADAANYLIKKFNIRRGVVAGDSGNDSAMLLETPNEFIAVAVGGYKPELGKAIKNNLRARRTFVDADAIRKAAESLLLFDDYLRGGSIPSFL